MIVGFPDVYARGRTLWATAGFGTGHRRYDGTVVDLADDADPPITDYCVRKTAHSLDSVSRTCTRAAIDR
jgi:hypothetical protein